MLFPSQRGGFIQVANDFPAQRPQVIDVLLNGLQRQVRSGQGIQERPEAGHQFLARRDALSSLHERGQLFKSRR